VFALQSRHTASASRSDRAGAGRPAAHVDHGRERPRRARRSVLAKAAREFVTTPLSVLLASVMVNLLALALPLTLMQIYDRILPNAAINTMGALLLGLAGVAVLDVGLRLMRDAMITQTALENAFRQRMLAIARLLHTDPARISAQPGRFWLERMVAVEDVASVRENADKALFIDLPFIAIFLVMTGLVGGWLVAVPLTLIAGFVLVMLGMTRRQRRLMEERRVADEKRYTQIKEWLGGIGTIKLLAMETQIYRRFEAMLARGVGYSYHAVLQNNRLPMMGQLFSNLMMVAVSTGGAVRVIDGSMSIGSLACCSLLTARLAQPVFRVVSIAAQLQSLALTEERASTVYDLPLPALPRQTAPLRGSIRLEGVSVPPGPGWGGFRSLDLAVEPGGIVGITGPLKSGKSALLSLIDGTLAPASGRVLIDGQPAPGLAAHALRRQIQRIDGRVAIFRGTILENVAMFRAGTYIAEAVAAMEALGLDAQINKLPEGYDTPIGDGAQMVLPYGLQQSLMIARALAQQPAILLVAQIGALLDLDNFRRLERALQVMPSRPTAILASERAAALPIADRLYDLRGGRLLPLEKASPAEAGAQNAGGAPVPPPARQGRQA
jgi:ATP-binding cassette, subfamily C, bacterial LapB